MLVGLATDSIFGGSRGYVSELGAEFPMSGRMVKDTIRCDVAAWFGISGKSAQL